MFLRVFEKDWSGFNPNSVESSSSFRQSYESPPTLAVQESDLKRCIFARNDDLGLPKSELEVAQSRVGIASSMNNITGEDLPENRVFIAGEFGFGCYGECSWTNSIERAAKLMQKLRKQFYKAAHPEKNRGPDFDHLGPSILCGKSSNINWYRVVRHRSGRSHCRRTIHPLR